jgi:hypothetical protein
VVRCITWLRLGSCSEGGEGKGRPHDPLLAESGKVYEAFGANLESPEGQSAGHFADSEALLAFLQEHPDTAYHLDPVPGPARLHEGPADPGRDVFCGEVRFDSRTGGVVVTRSRYTA